MMKKLRYLLLMMLCAVVTGAWAEDSDVTLDFTSPNNWNIPTSGTNKTLASFTDGTYTIKLYSTTNYKMNNGYLILGKKDSYLELPEFSSDVEKIEVVGHSGASGSVGQNIYVGDVAVSTATTGANGVTNVYEIDANYQSAGNVYKLMITTAHNTQIEYIKVYFVADPSDTRTATTVAIDDAGITNTNVFNGTDAGSLSATVMAGETAVDGASVTWSSATESVATIDASTGAVTLVGAGSTVITATYEGDETNYKPSSATYELTVTNTDPNAPGTANNPYTVAQAIENTPSSGNVYIKGKVSGFYSTDIVSDGTNYRYYISDDGTTTNQLLVYRGKGLNNVAFSSADDLQIGDQVVIYGELTTYNSTKEVAANNYIVSLSRKPTPTITFKDENNEEITSVDVAMNDMVEVSATCSAGDVTLTFSSEDATIADYDDGHVLGYKEGTTTITASFAGNDDYRATTAQLTVNVTDSRSAVTLAFENVPETINLDATATYTATATPAVTGITYSSSDDNIVMVDDETGEIAAMAVGTATITASFGGDSQYKPAEASYTIKVVDPNAKVAKFAKVTDASKLAAGDKLIIVYESGSVALSNEWNNANKNIKATAIEIDETDNTIEQTDKLEVFTLGGATDSWTLQGATLGYIGNATSGTSNYVVGGLEATAANAKAKISITDGNAIIEFAGGCSKKWLRYNSSSSIFACYGETNQSAVQLYKEVVELPDITLTDDSDSDNSSIISANDGQKVNATVSRTLSPNYYNTLFLPFDMTADQITEAFGEGAQVATFTGEIKNETSFQFANVTAMEAYTGYLVKPAATVNGFTVEGATIESTVPSVETDWAMIGTLDNFANSTENGDIYYFTTSGTVKKLSATGNIKGLRAFMCNKETATSIITSISSNAGLTFGGGSTEPARADEFVFYISIDGDDDVTAINAIDGVPVLDANAPVYNLAGQRVGQSYKGVVIQNGKKFVIK